MRLPAAHDDRPARLEMVPLMDCIFLLLVFFVYATLSMIVHRGIKVQLPSARAVAADKHPYVAVAITHDNRVFVDDQPVTIDRIVPAVVARMGQRKDKAVYVRGDERSGFGTAFRVLEQLRAAGIDKVSFECKEAQP